MCSLIINGDLDSQAKIWGRIWDKEFVKGFGLDPDRGEMKVAERFAQYLKLTLFRDLVNNSSMEKPKIPILSLGFGNGTEFVPFIETLGAERVLIYGVDVSSVGCNKAAKLLVRRNVEYKLIQGTFRKIPLPDNSIAAILAIMSLHFNDWSGILAVFSEIKRLAMPNAIIWLVVEAAESIQQLKIKPEIIPQKLPDGLIPGITAIIPFELAVHGFSLDELIYLFTIHDMTVIGGPFKRSYLLGDLTVGYDLEVIGLNRKS